MRGHYIRLNGAILSPAVTWPGQEGFHTGAVRSCQHTSAVIKAWQQRPRRPTAAQTKPSLWKRGREASSKQHPHVHIMKPASDRRTGQWEPSPENPDTTKHYTCHTFWWSWWFCHSFWPLCLTGNKRLHLVHHLILIKFQLSSIMEWFCRNVRINIWV